MNPRWLNRLLTFIVLFAATSVVNAQESSSPTLNEAQILLDISPKQAQALASEYLQKRQIVGTVKKSPSALNGEGNENQIRTPSSSIEAFTVLAQAAWKLGQQQAAQLNLEQAKTISREYQLPYKELELRLLDIRFQWLESHDAKRAIERLAHLKALIDKTEHAKVITERISYQATMMQGEIASSANRMNQAQDFFAQAKNYAELQSSDRRLIDYHIAVGQHFLNHERYNLALSELLIAYWSAVDRNASSQLAKANTLLAQVFYARKVYDRALIYLGQAADFYGNYQDVPVLAQVLKLMGDTYYQQGRFNLALVHYLNVLDHEKTNHLISQYIDIRIKLAETYYQLDNYPLAQQYLQSAINLLDQQDIAPLRAQASLLETGLAYQQGSLSLAEKLGLATLALAQATRQLDLELATFKLLSQISERQGNYLQALSYARQYDHLSQLNQVELNQISEDAFRQQKEFVEQTLHLIGQEQKLKTLETNYSALEKIAFGLFIIAFLFFLVVLRRGLIIHRQEEEIDQINGRLFTHSRSNLSNLRMLNANLPSSLRKSSRTYEQWHIGELIHEPLSDRLRFAMIDVPFLRNMYLQYGYTAGLELERAFGNFLKEKLGDNMRLFHFTDANLLYVEKNQDRDAPPQELFDQIKSWIDEFQPSRDLNRIIRMGIADYPFLPRAYTAINEKELLDILLMATETSRELSISERESHWVYLKAIDNAPAASFVSNNVRKACRQAINQGIIKVHSSCKNEENIKELLKDD
jgi:hypothetical protein